MRLCFAILQSADVHETQSNSSREINIMADGTDVQRSVGDEKHPAVPMSNENHPPFVNKASPARDSYWFAHSGVDEVASAHAHPDNNVSADGKENQLQKEKEERIRIFREQQEEERLRRLKELEQSFILSRKYREQQEEERRRKIEEAKIRESERRQQVEERKRQIWEAEQERKEAILRRNLEREARIEARRNAQRNSLSFAFGSSTPRTFDLDLAAIGTGRNSAQDSPLMSAVSGRKCDERDFGTKRATSACSLDRKSEFEFTNDDDNNCNLKDHVRSSSLEPMPGRVNIAKQLAIERMKSEAMKACLTMLDDDSITSDTRRHTVFFDSPSPGWLMGSGVLVGDDLMSRSMVSLSTVSRGRKRTDLMPSIPRERCTTPSLGRGAKDNFHSPSRPHSSMSGQSEVSVSSSQASCASLRPKPAPRRPRPISLAGSIVSRSAISSAATQEKGQERQPRPNERNATKPPRAKSAGPESATKSSKLTISSTKKPIPPPKSAEVLARAKSHPVPIKDNLRKVIKPANEVKKDNLPSASNDSKIESLSLPKSATISAIDQSVSNVIELKVNTQDDVSSSISMQSDLSQKSDTLSEDKSNSVEADTNQKSSKENIIETEKQQESVEQQAVSEELNSSKPRITSEEEAKAALAEKRRLAREQAEREAELERQRQEELRRQEEERKRQEELEQKRLEEEQIRLAELHRQLEEEKLRKAIEEQKQREKEEMERREEEMRLRAEKEEQEKRAREEAERQRLELEEKLRKEEEERAERKRRVEQIMSRTRNKGSQSGSVSKTNTNLVSPAENKKNDIPVSVETTTSNGEQSVSNNVKNVNDFISESNIRNSNIGISSAVIQTSSKENIEIQSNVVKPLNFSNLTNGSSVRNGFHQNNSDVSVSKTNVSNALIYETSRTASADVISPMHTNGYNYYEQTSCISSPEEKSETSESSVGLLLNLDTSQQQQPLASSDNTKLEQLINFESTESTCNSHNDNFLMNADVVNSNVVTSENPFIVFEDSLTKKQETTVTDLLS